MMVKITVRLPAILVKRLNAIAANRGTTVSPVFRQLIEEGLDRISGSIYLNDGSSCCLTRPILERILVSGLACQELAVHYLDGRKDRSAILEKIEARVLSKVDKILGAEHA